MTITVSNTEISHTGEYWRNRTNELAHALSTKVLTTDSNTTIGNVAVDGTFLIGNSTVNSSVNSTVIDISSGIFSASVDIGNSLTINTSMIFIGNSTSNIELTQTGLTINGSELIYSLALSAQTVGTSAQMIDAISKTAYRGAEYVATIKDNAANAVQISKILALHDGGTTGYVTEYGIVYSNTNLGAFSANANSTHLKIYFTPTVANSQLNSVRSLLAIS